MKISELLENDEIPTADLRDLSAHVYHGRIFCDARNADEVLTKVYDLAGGLDDVLVWHDWISDTVYEITIAAKSKEDVVKVLQAKPSRASWCYKPSGETIRHQDWRPL